ncbi:hypothetical protein HPP92_001911 [Vanilla planifolia]|uniref:Uncharacterized protein n=1 Tax=Vanilla planifolia TaxID=51239 RepID=A0A835S5F1_VANPL|nr:hypothetical protein HPP92_001911 [Vanilla planifolia]
MTTIFPEREASRIWQDIPVLVMISMLAYFCFLEQLLVSEMGARALAISLPCSCVLGLLSSFVASTMVNKGYIWVYASFQFAIVIVFAHVFYNVFNVAAVLSVILSSFTGFGIAFSANSLLVEVLKWRTRRNRRLELQQNNGEQQQTTANSETQHGEHDQQPEVQNTDALQHS